MSDISTVHKQVKVHWRRKRVQTSVKSTISHIWHTPRIHLLYLRIENAFEKTSCCTNSPPRALLMNFLWNYYCSRHYYSKVNASLLAQLILSILCPRQSRYFVIIVISTSSDPILAIELRSHANNDVALSWYPTITTSACRSKIEAPQCMPCHYFCCSTPPLRW